MKVYLEEKDMPKDYKTTCKNCPFRGDEGLGCEERRMLDKDFICPLQPLTDYTKQVRKEAVKEVLDFIEEHKAYYFEQRDYYGAEYIFFNRSNLEKDILDQISTTEKI